MILYAEVSEFSKRISCNNIIKKPPFYRRLL